jgi:hypothetical protein
LLFDSYQLNNSKGIQAPQVLVGLCDDLAAPMHRAQRQCRVSGMDLGFELESLLPVSSPANNSKQAA